VTRDRTAPGVGFAGEGGDLMAQIARAGNARPAASDRVQQLGRLGRPHDHRRAGSPRPHDS
jgi:hypothetical protein